MPEYRQTLDASDAVLRAAREAHGCDDMILWVRSAAILITVATTVTDDAGIAVDLPLGKGLAGRAAQTGDVVIIDDFNDSDELKLKRLLPQQPNVVALQGWRSAIFVPLRAPRDTAVLAAYSRLPRTFNSLDAGNLEVWGERALLRALQESAASRVTGLGHMYDELSKHIHDIRQYATTALMNAEGVRDGSRGDISRAVTSLQRLLQLTERDLRVVSLQRPKLRTCNASQIVRESVEEMRPRAAEFRVTIAISGNEHSAAVIDPQQLRRAVANLIANSIQQLEDIQRDRKRVSVSVKQGRHYTTIEVDDNGPGIQPDRIARIFDPGVSYSGKGFGIGLSQVEAAITAARGFVKIIRNDFGEGCTFALNIPTPGGGLNE